MSRPRLLLPAFAALLVGACTIIGADRTAPQQPVTMKRVYTVDSVQVRTLEGNPEQLYVSAQGTARTGGWTQPQLRPVSGGDAGLVILEFVAPPPPGPATQALSPVSAMGTFPKPANYQGVRVLAETNSKEAGRSREPRDAAAERSPQPPVSSQTSAPASQEAPATP